MSTSYTVPALEHAKIAEHSLLVGLYKICENCERSFFRCSGSTTECCCACYEQLHHVGNQLWLCVPCGTYRAWGMGAPFETISKDLRCARCSTVTAHEFWKVA